MAAVQDIIDSLNEICNDTNATKNLKVRITEIINILKAEEELTLKVNKAAHALDEIASNSDVDSYTRTQLLGVVSALETVEEE